MVRTGRVSAWLLLALAANASTLHSTSAVDGRSDPTRECIRAAPRQLSQDQTVRLCVRAAHGLGDGPALCASAALRASPHFVSAGSKADSAEDLVSLCGWATDTRPAECWASVSSSQMHRSYNWRKAMAAVCSLATDTRPAQCLLAFKRYGFTTSGSSSRHETAMAVVIEVCEGFQGDAAAIETCLTRAPRSLSETSRFELCRHGDPSAVVDVVDCAKQLLQRNTKPEIVVRVCASAAKPTQQPQVCVLAAQQQLRWMDTTAVAHLCAHSQATIAPVQCVTALRSWFIAQFTKQQPILDLARLCHGTNDADTVVNCVKTLPSQLFDADQVVQLCRQSHDGPVTSGRVECVTIARQQLFGLSLHLYLGDDGSSLRVEHAALLMELCDDADASVTPLDCVASTATQSPPFTVQQRVRLCQHATSSMPHQCFRAIHVAALARLPNQAADGIELCRAATSLAPATCMNLLGHCATAFFQSGLALQLCRAAVSSSPATCYAAAPRDFSDHDKVTLCTHADADEPAACAKEFLPRVSDNTKKAQLCAKATSTAPARCASASPFGMSADEIIALCREAATDKPAYCAREVPSYLKIPWRDVATVCQGATTTTPGSCLAFRVRQREPLSHRLIAECRAMVSTASTIEILQFAYECKELLPRCPIILTARVLDQFGDEMPTLSHGYVHFSATPDAEDDLAATIVRGVTVTPIVNGSANFRDLQFIVPGNFTIRLMSSGVDNMIARLHVRTNETETRERDHCERVFSFMQCGPLQPLAHEMPTANHSLLSVPLQTLRLPNRFVLVGLQCESLWATGHAGLKPIGSVRDAKLYGLPRIAYQLLTGHNLPTATMNAWECLGIPEGSNRSAIRRAYHKRSLEWHPDKWTIAAVDTATVASLREKVETVYTRINDAYQQLIKADATLP